jgi:Flp pilus assembly protein TadG
MRRTLQTKTESHRSVVLRTRAGDERGAMLALVALGMIGLMGMLVLTLDAGFLHRQRRMAQTAADAGAQAGAIEIFREHRDSAIAAAYSETSRNGFANGVNNVAVTVNNPPVSGPHNGDTLFVEVIVQQSLATFFGKVVNKASVSISPRSVAGVVSPVAGCMYVLDPTASKALEIKSDGDVIADNCEIVVNSNSSTAVSVSNNGSTLDAASIAISGGYTLGSGATISPDPQTGVPATPDPLAYLTMPAIPATCDYFDKTVSGGATETLSPGVYCGGLNVQNNLTVANLNPGLYILRGKQGANSLNIQAGATINSTGTGVTFIITSDSVGNYGPVNFQSGSFVNLSATASPATNFSLGILIYQDPAAPSDIWNIFHSSTTLTLNGTLYFPTQYVELGGSGADISITGGIVAKKIKVQSDGTVNLSVGGGGLGQNPPFRRPTIVE